MNEDKTVNQEPINQDNIAKPEDKLEQIETKVAQTPQVDAQIPTTTPEPVKPTETVTPQPTVSQGLRHSRGIYLTAIILLVLSLIILGIYFL